MTIWLNIEEIRKLISVAAISLLPSEQLGIRSETKSGLGQQLIVTINDIETDITDYDAW